MSPLQEPSAQDDDVKVKLEDGSGAIPAAFADVFAHFQLPGQAAAVRPFHLLEPLTRRARADSTSDPSAQQGENGNDGGDEKGQVIYSDDELPSEDEDEDAAELSKRKQRKMNRLSVAELKRLVKKPEVVDWVDVSANDPRLLVEIKSHRNTVPIPQHWQQKSAYLNGKRGIEKPPYQLPSASLFRSLSLSPLPALPCPVLCRSLTFTHTQVSSPTRASRRSATPSRRRRTSSRSSRRRASACSPRWARSTSTTRSSTTPSSGTRPSPR